MVITALYSYLFLMVYDRVCDKLTPPLDEFLHAHPLPWIGTENRFLISVFSTNIHLIQLHFNYDYIYWQNIHVSHLYACYFSLLWPSFTLNHPSTVQRLYLLLFFHMACMITRISYPSLHILSAIYTDCWLSYPLQFSQSVAQLVSIFKHVAESISSFIAHKSQSPPAHSTAYAISTLILLWYHSWQPCISHLPIFAACSSQFHDDTSCLSLLQGSQGFYTVTIFAYAFNSFA